MVYLIHRPTQDERSFMIHFLLWRYLKVLKKEAREVVRNKGVVVFPPFSFHIEFLILFFIAAGLSNHHPSESYLQESFFSSFGKSWKKMKTRGNDCFLECKVFSWLNPFLASLTKRQVSSPNGCFCVSSAGDGDPSCGVFGVTGTLLKVGTRSH